MIRWMALLAGLAISVGVQAVGGPLQFDGQLLRSEAQTRACYLGFIKLYDAEYFHAGDDSAAPRRCVRLSYLRGFSADQLDESTIKVFRERHGDSQTVLHRDSLALAGQAYRAVEPGDRYTYCVASDRSGSLLREGRAVARFDSTDFAARFMQIWVLGEDTARRPQWAFGEC